MTDEPKIVLVDASYRERPVSHADQYRGSNGRDVTPSTTSVWTGLPMLEFLWGQPWDDHALACVTALRPSKLRVTNGELTSNAVCWRVTVYLENDSRTIRRIEQEVTASAFDLFRDGQELRMWVDKIKETP